jgi:hypothetical protein
MLQCRPITSVFGGKDYSTVENFPFRKQQIFHLQNLPSLTPKKTELFVEKFETLKQSMRLIHEIRHYTSNSNRER